MDGMEITARVVRNLSASDLVVAETTSLGSTTPPLKRLHDSHHWAARLLAQGLKAVQVSAITGFSQSRLSILKNDPAFKELVEHYRNLEEEIHIDTRTRLSTLSLDAIEAIRERLHDNPEDFKVADLLNVATAGLDRTGHGPKSTQETLNKHLILTREDLEEIKTVRVLQAKDQEPDVGRAGSTPKLFQVIEAEGGEGEGTDVREESREMAEAPRLPGDLGSVDSV